MLFHTSNGNLSFMERFQASSFFLYSIQESQERQQGHKFHCTPWNPLYMYGVSFCFNLPQQLCMLFSSLWFKYVFFGFSKEILCLLNKFYARTVKRCSFACHGILLNFPWFLQQKKSNILQNQLLVHQVQQSMYKLACKFLKILIIPIQ